MQKTIATTLSVAASLMLIAGTLAPIAYGATPTSAQSCTIRATLTADETSKLAPGDTAVQNGISAGSVLSDPSSGVPLMTPNWGILCSYSVIKQITDILFLVVAILSVALIIFSAFKFITAGASPKGEEEARRALLYAVIGILVATAAKVIPAIALGLIGVH